MTRRMLLTLSKARCPFGCVYCFADFSQYRQPLSLTHMETLPELVQGVDILYPACDVDLFATRDPLQVMKRTAAFKCSISVSTKARLSLDWVAGLASINQELMPHGRILKIGISIATKYRCASLEPRTATYQERVENLRLLQRASVPSCLVLKPILADVPVNEYCEILNDCAGLTRFLLTGDEYLDVAHPRIAVGTVGQRIVPWVLDKPLWPVSADADRMSVIQEHARGLGMLVFDSDLDLLTALSKVLDERVATSAV